MECSILFNKASTKVHLIDVVPQLQVIIMDMKPVSKKSLNLLDCMPTTESSPICEISSRSCITTCLRYVTNVNTLQPNITENTTAELMKFGKKHTYDVIQ